MRTNHKKYSGYGDLSHTPNNPNSCTRSSLRSPGQSVGMEQKWIIFWSLLHIATLVCFVLGIYYTKEYMLMPDRVIICDQAGNLYRGKSCNVLCQATAEDIARKSAMAFLTRNGEHSNRQALEALFGRSAQKSLRILIGNSQEEFKEQSIQQIPVIEMIEIAGTPEKDQCLAFVRGTLHRNGIYMKMPYYQKLEFTLGLRLMRSGSLSEYPLRVLRMVYDEKSVYDNKKGENQ